MNPNLKFLWRIKMSIKKTLFFTVVCLSMTASFALAQGAPSAPAKAAVSEKKTCPPYDDPKMKGDATPIAGAIDKNKDGKLTKEEWTAAGAPINSFNYFTQKSKKDFVTREEFLAEAPPNGIDANCDGKMTIQEFQEFDKKQSQNSGDKGSAPKGNAPAGAPPAGGTQPKK
jgi:hypothetical protein